MRPLLPFAVAGVVVAAWMGASQPGVAQEAPDRPGLSVSHAGLTARASLGSFCADGLCADALHPPQPKGRLPVRSRARLTLRFTRDATTVEAALGRRGTRVLSVQKVTARKWKVRLPRRLHGARIVDVFASGDDWDGSFWAGIRAGCR